MKFAKTLEAESIPEWRKAYINYKGLKKRLRAIEKYRKTAKVDDSSHLRHIINAIDDTEDNDEVQTYPNAMRRAPRRKPNRTQSSVLDDRGLQPRDVSTTNRAIHRVSSASRLNIHTDQNEIQHSLLPEQDLRSLSLLDEALRHATEPEQYFFVKLDEDLEKISRFYNEKEKEAEAKYEALKLQVKLVQDFAQQLQRESELDDGIIHSGERLNPMNWFKPRGSTEEAMTSDIPTLPASVKYNGDQHMSYNVARNRLKKAITEYYRSLELLRSYRILNLTGFQKILKKFDKTAGWKASKIYMHKVDGYRWADPSRIEEFIKGTENLYVEEFADGHRRKGMAKLRTPEKDEHYTHVTWRVGFYIGLSVALFARVLQLGIDPQVRASLPNIDFNMQIYACFALPILFCLGFAINTIVWSRSHINYKFIFEVDPRHNLNYHEFAELPCLILLLLGAIMYIDLTQLLAPTVPSELCPLIFFVLLLAVMTCPFPILYRSSRRWLYLSLGRIVLSYFFPVEFRDFFIADELNSLSYSFWTFSYFVCAYNFHWNDLKGNCPVKIFWYTPFLACLPPWWRLLQCIRRYKDSKENVHLVNGLKYCTSIAATLATGYRRMHPNSILMEVIWVACSLISSTYTSLWDLKMDWGLLQPNSSHFLLRDELVFYRWTYYTAAPINVILRFAWSLNSAGFGFKGELIGFITALLEAYRRIQWNFFRLENEHLNNVGNYRAIKEIPLPFALQETTKQSVFPESNLEEGRIQLPLEEGEITSPAATLAPSHHHALGGTTPAGSFYGCRDYENRQDFDDTQSTTDNIKGPGVKRQASMMDMVLDRMKPKSQKKPVDTSSSSEDDEDDDSEDEQQNGTT